MPQLFRDHDSDVVPGLTVALYHDLAREWATLQTLASSRTRLRQWGRRYPLLAGCDRPGDVVDLIDRSSLDDKDAILHALLTQFQAGQQLAGRIVLQAMLPKLVGIATAHLRRSAAVGALELDDAHGEVIGEFWTVMSDLPLRRTHKLAANLTRELERALIKPRTLTARPHDPVAINERRDQATSSAEDDASPTVRGVRADDDLRQVLTWALDRHIITADQACLLGEIYLADNQSRATAARATADGVTPAAIRKRCQLAKDAIVAAVVADSLGTPSRSAHRTA